MWQGHRVARAQVLCYLFREVILTNHSEMHCGREVCGCQRHSADKGQHHAGCQAPRCRSAELPGAEFQLQVLSVTGCSDLLLPMHRQWSSGNARHETLEVHFSLENRISWAEFLSSAGDGRQPDNGVR